MAVISLCSRVMCHNGSEDPSTSQSKSIWCHQNPNSQYLKSSTPMTGISFTLSRTLTKKVELLHHSMSELFKKNCPIRHVRKPVDKPVITSPLIQKLKRAKQRACKKGKPLRELPIKVATTANEKRTKKAL